MSKKSNIINNITTIAFFGGLLVVVLFSPNISATTFKNYSKHFKVSPQNASLDIYNPTGSIKVTTWDKAEIKLSAFLDDHVEVSERQQGSSIEIEVHCAKIGQARFEVNIPQECTLDLTCLNGPIEVWSVSGPISAQTTEGEITLQDLTSNNIVAKTTRGVISYKGILDKKGIYNFSSIENSINITIPASNSFTLSATASPGKVHLGGFSLTDSIPHERRISGKYAGGGAMLNIKSHHGEINLRKHP